MASIAELKLKIKFIQEQLDEMKVDGAPPNIDGPLKELYDTNATKLATLRETLVDRVLSGQEEAGADSSLVIEEHRRYGQLNMLLSAVADLPKFTGTSPDATTSFIARAHQINSNIQVDWITFRGALCQKLSTNVFKTMEQYEATTPIKNMEGLKTFLNSQYGSKTSLAQRLEQFWTAKKGKNQSYSVWASAFDSKIATLEAQLKEERRKDTKNPSYELKVEDAFELLKLLRFYQELKTESNELYKIVSSESEKFKTTNELAQRAEILLAQSFGGAKTETFTAVPKEVRSQSTASGRTDTTEATKKRKRRRNKNDFAANKPVNGPGGRRANALIADPVDV